MKPRALFFLTLVLTCLSLFIVSADDGPRDVATSTTPTEVRQWEITGPWGGDVRSLVVAPDNSDLLYVGTSDGQIFRSTDSAKTWR
jgi:hypothetical protein